MKQGHKAVLVSTFIFVEVVMVRAVRFNRVNFDVQVDWGNEEGPGDCHLPVIRIMDGSVSSELVMLGMADFSSQAGGFSLDFAGARDVRALKVVREGRRTRIRKGSDRRDGDPGVVSRERGCSTWLG